MNDGGHEFASHYHLLSRWISFQISFKINCIDFLIDRIWIKKAKNGVFFAKYNHLPQDLCLVHDYVVATRRWIDHPLVNDLDGDWIAMLVRVNVKSKLNRAACAGTELSRDDVFSTQFDWVLVHVAASIELKIKILSNVIEKWVLA